MVLKKEQQRMKELLTEAMTVLCEASLQYHTEFNIEGLLGITLDNHDIILININKRIRKDAQKSTHTNDGLMTRNELEMSGTHSPKQPSLPENAGIMRRPSISPTYSSTKRHRSREAVAVKQELPESSSFSYGHPAELNDRSPAAENMPSPMAAAPLLPLSVTTTGSANLTSPGRSSWSLLPSPVHQEFPKRSMKEPSSSSPVVDTKPGPGSQASEHRSHARREEERHWPRVKAGWASEYAQRTRYASVNNEAGNKELTSHSTTPTKSQPTEVSDTLQKPVTVTVTHPVGRPYYPTPQVTKAAFHMPLLSPSESEILHKDFTRIHSLSPHMVSKVGLNARPTSLPLFGVPGIILRSPDPSSISPSSVKSATPTTPTLLWPTLSPVLTATSPISTQRTVGEERTSSKAGSSKYLKSPVSESVSRSSTASTESGTRVGTPCLPSPVAGPVHVVEEADSPQAMDLSTIATAVKIEASQMEDIKPILVTPTAASSEPVPLTARKDGPLPQRRYRGMSCQICTKFCRCPAELKRHMRTHTRARPYKCNSCTASFALKSNLTRHQRVHTGVREFACLFCSRTFALLFNCKKHVTAAHNKDAHQFSPRQYRQHALMLHMKNSPKSPVFESESSAEPLSDPTMQQPVSTPTMDLSSSSVVTASADFEA